MILRLLGLVCTCLVLRFATCGQGRQDEESSSCTQIDFDEATLTSLCKCDYTQQFSVKRYDESDHFDPYRPDTLYYLSNRWEGLTCGETVATYSFNADTELRMAYNLIFDSGATLEVRVYDLDRDEADAQPTLVEVWTTTASTDGWGFFREKLNKTVKKAKIQIEANINAGSHLAIEYLTIFNYEVETGECSAIDEFLTTTESPSTTTHLSTTTSMTTTTETTTTELTTVEEITPSTTEVTVELSTTTSEPTTSESTTSEATTTTTTTTTTSSTTAETTPISTTTNGPRDDTSIVPSLSTTVETTSSTAQPTDTPVPTSTSTTESVSSPPDFVLVVSSTGWIWMTLTALFATLFLLSASAASYLWFVNLHLDRVMLSVSDELDFVQQYVKK